LAFGNRLIAGTLEFSFDCCSSFVFSLCFWRSPRVFTAF
jgi:hypothetical protein